MLKFSAFLEVPLSMRLHDLATAGKGQADTKWDFEITF